MNRAPRFFADVMLGTLAKWLRILGYDTEYDNSITDTVLAERCAEEDRIALTRDSRLAQRRLLRDRCLLIRQERLLEQLHEVLDALAESPNPTKMLTRCLDCNTPLAAVNRSSIEAEVPPYVYRNHHDFKRCPVCRKIYWKGTHREHIVKSLFDLREAGPSGEADPDLGEPV